MTAITHPKKPSASGCGCGAGSGCGSAGCACGNQACTETAFSRPRFFAGQLLTQEDLQLLIDYVVGKNRLHNRHLFGDGVACGLVVTCNPCGDGSIHVAPGYALDCCGNDIFVPCPETLDVNALVRDLRIRQLQGADCGDPCDDKHKDGLTRRYCLYLRYHEAEAEPVAPYVADEPCSQIACEPSRINEGYRFELRCDKQPPDPPDVLDRIKACVGDLEEAAALLQRADKAQVKAVELDYAAAAIRRDEPIEFTVDEAPDLKRSSDKLALFEKQLEAGEFEQGVALKGAPRERVFREGVAEYQVMTAAVVRLNAMAPDKREKILKERPDIAELCDMNLSRIRKLGPSIRQLAPKLLDDAASREAVEDLVELAQVFTTRDVPPEAYRTARAKMLISNAPTSPRQVQAARNDAALIKAWLLDRLEASKHLTSCDLIERVKAIDTSESQGQLESPQLARLSASTMRLLALLLDYFKDCVCLALNPPCDRCDDTAVLLACLEVKDCKVIDICNMSRQFVLSPAAMRYWLPPISWVGELFERFCCELDLSRLGRKPTSPEPQASLTTADRYSTHRSYLMQSYTPTVAVSDAGEDAVRWVERAGFKAADIERTVQLTGNLARVSARLWVDPVLVSEASFKLDPAVLFRRPARRAEPVDAVDIQRTVETTVAGEVSVAVHKEVTEYMTREVRTGIAKDVQAEVAKNLPDSVEKLDVIKALRKENADLRKSLATLAEQVKRLQR